MRPIIFFLDSLFLFYAFLALVNIYNTLLAFVFAIILQTFVGKSIGDSSYTPVIGTWFDELFSYDTLYDQQTAKARKYKTARILAPVNSEVYTTDPQNIEHFLETKISNYSKGFNNSIFMFDGDKWKHQRKLVSHEFSTRVLRDFSCSVFRKNAVKLVGMVQELSEHREGFDVQALLMRYSSDSIFKVGFGVDLNCLEGTNERGLQFIKSLDESNEIISGRHIDPLWTIKRYFNIGSEKTLKKNIKFIHGFANDVIQTKRQQMDKEDYYNDKEDILSRFLLESNKDAEIMTDEYLRDIILNFMISGKDTTATALSWFIYMLCKNPSIQEKLAQEIKQVINVDNNNVHNFVESITEKALEEMHFLHAALTETLRLYPVVPLDGKVAEVDDTLPDGYKIQKGDIIFYMAYAMGRMPYIWGDDAEQFKPERWLKNGVFQPESPFKFIAFNAGPRVCLGKDFAYRQMKIVSAALLQFFKFRLCDDTKNVTYKTMLTLYIDGGLHVSAIPRSTQAS